MSRNQEVMKIRKKNRKRFRKEIEHFGKWKKYLDHGDPFYNKNFSVLWNLF